MVDDHRGLRGGAPEAIFCLGKTPAQVVAIARRLAEHHANVVATRADQAVAAAVAEAGLPHVYHAEARLLVVRPAPGEERGLIVVAAAGTAGLPGAEGAALRARGLRNRGGRGHGRGRAGRRPR